MPTSQRSPLLCQRGRPPGSREVCPGSPACAPVGPSQTPGCHRAHCPRPAAQATLQHSLPPAVARKTASLTAADAGRAARQAHQAGAPAFSPKQLDIALNTCLPLQLVSATSGRSRKWSQRVRTGQLAEAPPPPGGTVCNPTPITAAAITHQADLTVVLAVQLPHCCSQPLQVEQERAACMPQQSSGAVT